MPDVHTPRGHENSLTLDTPAPENPPAPSDTAPAPGLFTAPVMPGAFAMIGDAGAACGPDGC